MAGTLSKVEVFSQYVGILCFEHPHAPKQYGNSCACINLIGYCFFGYGSFLVHALVYNVVEIPVIYLENQIGIVNYDVYIVCCFAICVLCT